LREIVARHVVPDAAGARDVTALNPAAISRLVQRRLNDLPALARVIAEAVAVVGDDAPIADITRYADLANFEDDPAVSSSIDALVEAQVLEFDEQRVRYSHPIVRSSVYGALSPTARAEGHRRAAELLRDGGDTERLAAHLLACPPLRVDWVVGALRDAARRATSLGALESARRYLGRALEERPGAGRLELLLELGAIEQVLDRPAAERTLREALRVAGTPEEYFRAAAALGTALVYSSNAAEAHEALLGALRAAPPGDEDGRMRVEAQIRMNAHLGGYLSASDLARIDELSGLDGARDSDGPGATLLLACMALTNAVSGDFTAAESAALARTVVNRQRVADRRLVGGGPYYAALRALMYADELEEAQGILTAMIADAEQRGLLYDFAVASWSQAEVCLRQGDLRESEAHGTVAVSAMQQGNWSPWVPGAVATLAHAQVERGATDNAWTTLGAIEDWGQYPERATGHLRYARGLYWLAAGNAGAAVEDFFAAGRLSTPWDRDFPPRLPWRSSAALAAHVAGDAERASALAAEELTHARRFGAPRALGIALRVTGSVGAPEDSLPRLEESVAVLERSQARLEYAKSLTAVGERLLARDRARAKELLTTALDLAERAGARVLATDAKALLVKAGGRPRRAALRGVDALTASERRVAEMAADGLSNKQIAQAIFVTTKTVELHLGNAYKKLGIGSRQQLPDVLGGAV
jgi:DNA-binding CsgD family transcriptional regulator